MNEWSHSRLQLYERCPLSFRYHYLDGEPGKPSAASIRGSQVHEFCELYARHCHEAKRDTDWSAGRALLASYSEEVRAIGESFMEDVAFDWNLIVADGESVERSFSVELPDGLGRFRGRVDLVQWNEYEGTVIVTDYKSGFGPWETPDECPHQLECYGWAMMQLFPSATSAQVIYRYLGNRRSYDWTLYHADPAWAVSLVRRIQADTDFEPTPSPQACAFCDYTHLCPLVLADPLALITDADGAAETLAQVAAGEARMKELRDALNAWTKAQGPLVAHGKRAGALPPVWHEKGTEFQLREGLRRDNVEARLLAAGFSKDDVNRLWSDPEFDGKEAGRLLSELKKDEDPFGAGEEDRRLKVLELIVEPRAWDGKTRFRIEDVKEVEEDAE